MFFKILPFLLIIQFSFLAYGQDYDGDLRNNRNRLSEIKSEISTLKNQLSSAKKKALSIGDQIELIDKEMSLIARTKGLLLT